MFYNNYTLKYRLLQEISEQSDNITELLFDKHVDYVANHGNDKNDFVSIFFP
jgi:hypothetical protein